MRSTRLRLPSPALVISCLALAIALGGAGYAAINLPRGSVATKHLKNGAVTSAKVKDRTLVARDFAPGAGFAAAFPNGNLPGKKTLKGTYAVADTTSVAAALDKSAISFPLPLTSAPVAHFRAAASPATAECPGSPADPRAAPGHLCVYEQNFANRSITLVDPTTNLADEASRFGVVVIAFSTGSVGQDFYSRGTGEVTAP